MKVAIVHSSGFKRLPAHVGGDRAYFDAEQAGLVPHPCFITGASAGAIASAVCAPWTEKNFQEVAEAIINLKKSDIYSWRHLTELCGALTLGESFLSFLPPFSHDFSKTRRGQILIESIRTGISLTTKLGLFYELLEQPSIFSSDPLCRLLKRKLDFEAIWNSDIKLEIPAADLKNAKTFYFTNYLPEHRQLPNRDDVLVDMILASSSVVAFLQAISTQGRLLDDAALLNNVPIDRAMQAGCDVIFVAMYRPYLEKVHLNSPTITWVEELNRAMDLAIGRSTELTLEGHEKTNHDLGIIETVEEIMAEMPPSEKLSHLKILLAQLSAYGLQKTKIIPVMCERSLPSLTFNKFKPEAMKKSYDLGYQAMKQAIEKNFK